MAVMPQWLGNFNQSAPEVPLRPVSNYGQAIGQALQGGAQVVQGQQDILQKMLESRIKAIRAEQDAMLLQKDEERKAAEAERKAKAEKDRLDFIAKVSKGREVSPTLAKNPSLSGPSQASSLPSAQELAQLELDAPSRMPSQQVSGMDSTRLMGEALNRPENRGEMAGGYSPYTRDEIPNLALQSGQMTPTEYMTSTKSPDRIQVKVIGDRSVLVNLDTHDVVDLGPAPVQRPPTPQRDRYNVQEIGGRKVKINLDTGEQQDLGPITEKKISPKDQATVKMKLTNLTLAKRQLQAVQDAFNNIKGSFSAGGFGQGKIPTVSGKAFDAAVNAMRNTITGLTRVPGIGSMSDFETKLSQAAIPNRSEYEDVTQQQIDQLNQLIQTLEEGYSSLAPEPAAAQRDFSQITESDIDNMSPEELKRFLAQ